MVALSSISSDLVETPSMTFFYLVFLSPYHVCHSLFFLSSLSICHSFHILMNLPYPPSQFLFIHPDTSSSPSSFFSNWGNCILPLQLEDLFLSSLSYFTLPTSGIKTTSLNTFSPLKRGDLVL